MNWQSRDETIHRQGRQYSFYFTRQIMKQYHDGPIAYEKRSCTDILCLIVFLLLTVFMFGVAIYAWTNPSGNFKKLTTAYDPDGKGCGVDYPKYPYIYFASPHSDSLWVTVCVAKCPLKTDTQLDCQPNSIVTSCLPKNDPDNTKTVQIYDSSLTANTLCLPTSSTLRETIAPAASGNGKKIAGVMEGWKLILLAIPISIALALIIMIIVRFTAGCFVYILIFLCIGTLVVFGIYIYTQPVGGTIGSTALFQNQTARTIVSILCFALAAAILVFFCCFKSRINLASKIVEVSAVFVAKNCYIVLIPLIMFLVTLAFLTLWILQGLGYYSLGTPTHNKHSYPYQHFELSKSIYALGALHIFYLLWVVFFLIHTSDFLIAGTASSWYFKRESPYSQTSQRYRGKHIGSVCMGSFFFAVIGFIKLIYTLLAPDEHKEHQGFLKYLRLCCDCLCCICMKIFEWFTVGAYTWINMAGDNYCTSGINSASLRLKNLASSSAMAILGFVFSVLIRIGITALTVFIIYLILQNTSSYKTQIEDSSLLLVLVGLLAFAVSCFFISVYSESIEALYVTYLMDVDAGMDGGNCPEELRDFINEAQQEEHMIPSQPKQ